MNMLKGFVRETAFMVRERAVMLTVLVMFVLSSVAVFSGISEVDTQRATIDALQLTDSEERLLTLEEQSDWGSAAYYSFYLTYDPPSTFAFAALGQRDSVAWKHRVRALALEGQIYERDAGNPVFALIGRFDFAFVATFLLPLVLIALLHDLRAGERAVGRHDLLVATATNPSMLWFLRATVRALAIVVAITIPLLVASTVQATPLSTIGVAALAIVLHAAFWTVVILAFSAWKRPAAVILSSLLGVWLLLAVVIPAAGRMVIDHLVELPAGSDILLTQREAVNDAWDLPKETTMDAFVARHPEWAPYATIATPFEWTWYFAFQQVGDQLAEPLTVAYREGRLKRDRWASIVALASPPALLERTLQGLAQTDVSAGIEYEGRVRAFHETLRHYYYPKLFKEEPFDADKLDDLPMFRTEVVR